MKREKTGEATPASKPKTRTNEPWIEVSQDAEGWHWQLWSGNGIAVCRNALPYETKKHCVQAIRLLPAIWEKVNVVAKVSEDE